MKRYYFKCTFLSDVILNAHSATEGNSESLRYVPGAKFLGIVARHYKDFKSFAFDIFHSGKVRFGDAHPAFHNQRTLRIPLAWYYRKDKKYKDEKFLQPKEIFQHHDLPDNQREDDQLKQIRQGFFANNGAIIESNHFFSIKSAYNTKQRRSEDGLMYGYDALRKGSQWFFSVDFDDESMAKDIVSKLKGIQHIGRSRSAQYGMIQIEESSAWTEPQCSLELLSDNCLVLYAESLLAFFDSYGQPTLQPELADLKLPDNAKILWDKSQIRQKVFAPWMGIRKSRDADRLCLEKGSVIVVEVPKDFDVKKYADSLTSGIGAYRSEGFGQVLVNPNFLKSDGLSHPQIQATTTDQKATIDQDQPLSTPSIIEKDTSDATILDWLEYRQKITKQKAIIWTHVNGFCKNNRSKFDKISASQWGSIRAIAESNMNYTQMMNSIFFDESSFLLHGMAKQEWNKSNMKLVNILKSAIEDFKNQPNIGESGARIFLIQLCSEMAKFVSKKKGDNK